MVGDIVQIQLRIRLLQIDGGGQKGIVQSQRGKYALYPACAVRGWGGKVVGVAVSAMAHDLSINFGTARFGGLEFFQQ